VLNDDMSTLSFAIAQCELATKEFISSEQIDMNVAFDALFLMSEFKKRLGVIESSVNEAMVHHMTINGERSHDFGTHVAERKISSRRKNWEHKTLIEAVINTSLADENGEVVNPSTGEVIDIISIAKPLIDNVIRNLTATAAIRDWRVTALRNIVPGMNPDDFCEVEKSEKVSILRK
jgi:hypothetical protein